MSPIITGSLRFVATCLALQVLVSSCVDHDHDSPRRARRSSVDAADAAADADSDIPDAAPSDSEPGDAGLDASAKQRELNARLIDLLREIEREAFMRCPCLAARGDYPSEDACREAVAFKSGWEDCVEFVPVAANYDEPLQCALTELQRRNDCLEPAACDSNTLGMCRAATIECPKLDTEVLVRVVQYCPRYVMLFH